MNNSSIDNSVLSMNAIDDFRQAASYMRQATALEKEISTIEATSPTDTALAFKYLSLGHFKDLLCEYRTAAKHYEHAAELYLAYDKISVASGAYYSAGKALYLANDPALRLKALTCLHLAKNLDQATGNKKKEEQPETHRVLEALIQELTTMLGNHK